MFDFGTRNPTRKWPPYAGQPLTLDLDAGSLNGVRHGLTLDRLSFLGPDEGEASVDVGEYPFYSLGLCVEGCAVKNMVTGYQVVFHDPDAGENRAFAGRVIARGRAIDLASMTFDDFAEEFGECYWFDRDDFENILFYEFPGSEWQIEFDLGSRLKGLTVTCEPLLADAEQRKAYHVTRPWPPAR
jgi:hypothetical protein